MSTPKKKNPVDLSKCKIGQKMRTREGGIIEFFGKDDESLKDWPYVASNDLTYDRQGHYYMGHTKDDLDIVEIIPLSKRTKAPSPKTVDSDVMALTSLFAQIAFSNDPAWVKRAVQALQFIKKP